MRLKEARKQAGYTQKQTEDITKINRSALSKYENGTLEPNLETLATLANFYNVTSDWLLGIGKQEAK